ncbi:MAG TPA: BatD family protein, partial [Thermoanaerobaculia bacterium]|nr:BatD family protein [Thermoanaerobaculia bacterium]
RFFGPPLSRSEQLLLRTDPKAVEVRPLPPAPPGFGGAVGDLSLAAQLEPREVRLGEAATLTLTLAGEGNLQAVQPPPVAPAPGVEVLPPQQHGEEKMQGTEIHGSRTWSFVVIPGRTGRHELQVPPVSFFDPETGQYRTASVAPVELTTLPRAPQPGSGEPSLHGIRSASFAGSAGGAAGGLVTRWRDLLPWLFSLPWALALLVVLARRRTMPAATAGEEAADPSAEARLQQRLGEARTEARPRQAAAQIEEAWREFLAARWDIPCATHSARWSAMLEERGADPEAARELVQLVDDLHYLRYAPQLSSTDTLRGEALDRCRRLVRRLR